MTKKQRKEIYLKAAELIGNIPKHPRWGCCPTISMVIYGENKYHLITETSFPEFFLFKPYEYYNNTYSWWKLNNGHKENKNERQTALLLAAEMCN